MDEAFDINIKGVVYGIQVSANEMKKEENGGNVINACTSRELESFELLGIYYPS